MSSEDESDGSRLSIPRGLTLEQAKNLRRDRQIEELAARLDEVLTRLDKQGRPSKKKYKSETESKSSSEGSFPRFKLRRRRRDDSSSEESTRPRRHHKRKDDDRNLRLDVPEFHGCMTDPKKYFEWVRRAETMFNFKGNDETKCCMIAECTLVGYASLWYDNLKKKRSKEGRSKIRTWEHLKRYMKKKFVPEDFIQDLFIKLQTFKQGMLSVETYISEFEKLNMLCDLDEKSEQKMARFIVGLNEKIQENVEIQPYWSFEEVCKVALRIEKQEKNKKSSSYSKQISRTYEKPRFEKGNPSLTFKQDMPKTESKPKGEDVRKCFNCQGCGHVSSTCPSKRVMTTHEVSELGEAEEEELEKEINEEEKEDEDDHISEVEPESNGPVLVLRRSLHTKPMPLEETQREKIFLTRCKVNDRLCEMIIDTGSCTNVVAITLVEKLKHPTSQHPHPYKLHWLSNSSDVNVIKQALISFSIGKFHDEVLCDVCPMDACHILLGRPWQYDRYVKYDGRTNIYVVKKGEKEKSVALKPLDPNLPVKATSNSKGVMLINEKEVERELVCNGLLYVLVSKEIEEAPKEEVPTVLKGLMSEFEDVFPDDLPKGLPPIRGIEHQIDLILGAPLPNKAAYRSNPEETKEMQK